MRHSPPPAPLSAFLAEHLGLVYSAALRQTRNPHLAEEIAQSVFLIATRKRSSIPATHTAAWLIKVTRHVALTHLRADRRRHLHEHRAAAEGPPMTISPDAPPTADPSLDEHLDAALAGLAPSDRELLIRRYFQNQPVADIAAALRVAPNTATKRLARALDKLRNALARRGVTSTTLSALPTILISNAIQKSPATLAAKILAASAAGAMATIPLGVLLMTTAAKATVAIVAAILILAASTAYIATRAPHVPAGPITTPIATPAAPGSAGNDSGFTTLTGIVKDPAGNPIADALVTQGDPPQLVHGYFTTHTDVDGQFTFPRVQVGTDLTLAVHADGFAPELITGAVTADPPPFTFSVKPAHTLRLRLLDARGNPLPNFALDPFFWRNTQTLRIYTFRRRKWTGPISDANGLVTWTDAPADAVTYDPVGQIHPNRQAAAAAAFLDKRFTVTASDQLQTVTIRDPIHVIIRALDAQSGTPLTGFTVTYGYGDSPTHTDYWQENETQSATGAEYHTAIRDISPFVPQQFYRVSAAGYAPSVQSFKDDQQNVTLTYRLSKQKTAQLTILRPDNAPAADAAVYTIPSSQNFSLQSSDYFHNGRFAMGGGQTVQHADADGHVVIADTRDPDTRIVVLDDAGFAELLLSDAAKSPIHLDAWATVDGIARIGHEPAANQTIALDYVADHPGKPYIAGTFITTTDADGHFSFGNVPPRHSFIGTWLEINPGTRYALGTIANPITVTLAPGPNRLTLGGAGRLITGRIVNADRSPLHAGISSEGNLTSQRESNLPSPELLAKVKAIRKLPPNQQQAAIDELKKSPLFLQYQHRHNQPIHQITFAVNPDGTFRIDDVPPDAYTFTTTILNMKNNTPLGSVAQPLVVPPSDAPLDLGDLPLKKSP